VMSGEVVFATASALASVAVCEGGEPALDGSFGVDVDAVAGAGAGADIASDRSFARVAARESRLDNAPETIVGGDPPEVSDVVPINVTLNGPSTPVLRITPPGDVPTMRIARMCSRAASNKHLSSGVRAAGGRGHGGGCASSVGRRGRATVAIKRRTPQIVEHDGCVS
jgi:hypothetical protein